MTVVKPSLPRLIRSKPLSQGLVGAWLFYEGGGLTANDLSGYGNNGSFSGGVTWAAGPFGYALNFDGSTGYVPLSNPPPCPSTNWSLAWSGNLGSAASYTGVISNGARHGVVPNTGSNIILINTDDTVNQTVSISGANQLGQHNWVLTFEPTRIVVYRDGAVAGSTTFTATSFTWANPVRIGFSDIGKYLGTLSYVQLFNRLLSTAEIAALNADSFQMFRPPRIVVKPTIVGLSNNKPKPSLPRLIRSKPLAQGLVGAWPFYEGSGTTGNEVVSGGSNNAPLGTGISWTGGPSGSALSFDGSVNASATVTALSPDPSTFGSKFSIVAYVTPNTTATERHLLDLRNVQFYIAPGGKVTVSGAGSVQSNTVLVANNTYLIAMTSDGTNVSIYINGKLDAQAAFLPTAAGAGIYIGRYFNATGFEFSGLYHGAWLYKRALSPAEVESLYADSFQMFRPSRTLFKAGAVSNIATFTADSTFTAVSGSITTINGSSTLAPNSGSTTTITGNSSSTVLAGSITTVPGNSSSSNNAGSTTSLTGVSTLSVLAGSIYTSNASSNSTDLAGSASTFNATSSLSVLSGSVYTINGDSSLVGKPQVTGSTYNLTGDSSLSGIAGSSNNPQGNSTLSPLSGSIFNIPGDSALSTISKDIFTINGNSSLTVLSGSISTPTGSSSLLNVPGSAYTIPGDSVLTGVGTYTINAVFTINGDSTFTIISKQTFKGISQKSAISIRQNKTGIGIRQRKTGININDG